MRRLRKDAPFNEAYRDTLYGGGGAEGYTDHPTVDEVDALASVLAT